MSLHDEEMVSYSRLEIFCWEERERSSTEPCGKQSRLSKQIPHQAYLFRVLSIGRNAS